MAFLAMVTLSIGLTVFSAEGSWVAGAGVARLPAVRYGQLLVICALGAYVAEKELHLRRLGRLLLQEQVAIANERARFAEMEALSQRKSQLVSDLDYEVGRSLTAAAEQLKVLQERQVMPWPGERLLDHVQETLQSAHATMQQLVAAHHEALLELLRENEPAPPREARIRFDPLPGRGSRAGAWRRDAR